jgi:hypothetical protein
MLGSKDIIKIFTGFRGATYLERRDAYSKLLSGLFIEYPFTVISGYSTEGLTHMTALADTDGVFPRKPVFVMFIIPITKGNDTTFRKEAEDTLKGLLKDSVAPVKVMKGACICGSRIRFYSYDRELEVFTPESQQPVCFDFDLAEQSGAVRMMEVVEEVKDVCRQLIPAKKFAQVPIYYSRCIRENVQVSVGHVVHKSTCSAA